MPYDQATMPGGVYLCQVSNEISCGACCGLYNVQNVSRSHLTALLAHRTALFAKTPRDIDGILAFKEKIEAEENQERPVPEFHHCPYIGFIDRRRTRIGCLLHPRVRGNNGVDYRGLSYYGGMACRVYFCPTYHYVPKVYKEIVTAAAGDWYLYGQVITEWRMLNAFFQELENRLNRPLNLDDLNGSDRGLELVREFLNLKISWPFRSSSAAGPVHYFFKDPGHNRPSLDYGKLGTAPSKFDILLVELESEFASVDAMNRAETILDDLLNRIVESCSRSKQPALQSAV